MSTDLFSRLRDLVDGQGKAELALVHNAQVATMGAYQRTPGRDTKADWDAARIAYQDTLERLQKIYLPEETSAPEGERFKNRKQALDWLKAQGYKVSTGKFYQNCEAGFPAIHRDGTVSRYQVMQYGQQLDVERRAGEHLDYDREVDEARKLKAEADRAEMQAEQMRRQMDRDWLHAESAWAAVAAIIGEIDDALRREFFRRSGEIILTAAGQQDRGPQVYVLCEEAIGRALDEVARHASLDVDFAEA